MAQKAWDRMTSPDATAGPCQEILIFEGAGMCASNRQLNAEPHSYICAASTGE